MSLEEDLVRFIAPQLPSLLNIHPQNLSAPDSGSLEKAKQIWQILAPEIQAQEVAQAAVEKLAQNPASSDWQQVLQSKLQEIFTARPDIAARVKSLSQEVITSEQTPSERSIQMSSRGNRNQMTGSVSGQSRVFGNVGGSIDESQSKITAKRGGQAAGANNTRSGSNFFSNNTVMLVLLSVLALGGVAWMLTTRIGLKGVEIETQGGGQAKQPKNAAP